MNKKIMIHYWIIVVLNIQLFNNLKIKYYLLNKNNIEMNSPIFNKAK